MVYPFQTNDASLRDKLIACRIYTSQYWKEVLDVVSTDSVEYHVAANIVCLPVDQRYGKSDLTTVVELLRSCL